MCMYVLIAPFLEERLYIYKYFLLCYVCRPAAIFIIHMYHTQIVNCSWQLANLLPILSFQDLSSFVAKSVKEIEHVMTVGNSNRTVG